MSILMISLFGTGHMNLRPINDRRYREIPGKGPGPAGGLHHGVDL